jgi:hypothetical protein
MINARNSSCTVYVYLLCFLLITHTVKLQKPQD